MKEIFISYSTVDAESAETVRNVLEKNGLSCWMAPRDIPGGSNYTKEIPIAIRNCKVFVLVLSKNAQNSHWVLKELDSAVNCGKVILPFMLEDCILNDEFNFLLTGAQRYSAYQKKAEAMETLIGRIRGILDAPNQAPVAEMSCQPEQPEEQPAQKAPVLYLNEAVCSACGGSDLTVLPKKVIRQGSDLVTLLLIPALAVAVCMGVLMLCALILPYEAFNVTFILLPIGFVGGGIWGNRISKNIVRRKLLRNRIQATCYRCNRCSKVFRFDTELED